MIVAFVEMVTGENQTRVFENLAAGFLSKGYRPSTGHHILPFAGLPWRAEQEPSSGLQGMRNAVYDVVLIFGWQQEEQSDCYGAANSR